MARPRKDSVKVPPKARILTAAEELFGQYGYSSASLADIASHAGIRRASLLYHFSSKDALYLAVQEVLFGDLTAALAPSFMSQAPFAERLMAMTGDYLNYLNERPTFAAIVVRDLIDDRGSARARILELLDPIITTVEQWVATEGSGIVRPDLDLRAALLMISSDALLRQATGPLGQQLWSDPRQSIRLSQQLFFGDSAT